MPGNNSNPVTHEDLLNMKNDIIDEVRKIVVAEHEAREKTSSEINALKFQIIENELTTVKNDLAREEDRNTFQHKEFYRGINTIDSRITTSRESLKSELGSKSQFNITTLIASLCFIGMVVIGIITLA